ncbi:acyl-CoA dehydrogenase family protein [Cytobacillus horneckiae]|uniref:Acyl-CoA dehydrogenase n=2 Tax=Cytobacillus horneckiae TaxID=549687 RepID=A0A2N0ZIU4_9BACI|nr:acyl-CoA dehydrogenase family protein [Cytobacillus horneckiae]MCM3177912.1 acyl-CoA dehydrogenase family protein [Cytobacillus horneckiae]MEC1157281.1 acyl-CoA dehydrogenase family protein [Cytobacillus horneckiae]MED2935838.1 acyl-CoA dehydrogenase family protein [Cytobacillus horneckiae]PKG29423.1 acyl-CoA dehydrogenase [Cytobacillus horneckiae]
MNFELSEENIQVREMIRGFIKKEVLPNVNYYEENRLFPKEIFKNMGKIGIFGACFPEKFGGSEMGFLNLTIIAEEISKAHPSLGYAFNMQAMTCPFTILNWGTDEQINKYVPDLIKANKIGMFALTESGGGSDPAGSMKTTARLVGDEYVLSGSKTWITFANEADVGVLFAKTDLNAGHHGISAFIVETNRPGFTAKPIEISSLGYMTRSCEVFLEDYRIPKENLLGKEGEGFKIAMNALDYGRLTVASRLVGIAQGCIDESLKYCNERVVSGKSIGEYQMIQHLIADMVVDTDAARLLSYRSGYLKDKGEAATRQSSYAKYFASEVAVKVTRSALEIFGGNGISDEYPIMKYVNYANMLHFGEGSANIQRILIANDALGVKNANRHHIKRRFSLNSDISKEAVK